MNHMIVIIGWPECGKTELARHLVAQHLAAGRIAIVHDAYRLFHKPPVCAMQWESPERFVEHLADVAGAGESLAPAHAFNCEAADPVIELAISLGKSPTHPDMDLVLDEGSLIADSKPSYVSDRDRGLIARRRKLRICPIVLAQDTGILGALWYELATDYYLFHLKSPRREQRLAELTAVDGLDVVLPTLEPHEWIHVRRGADARRAKVRKLELRGRVAPALQSV